MASVAVISAPPSLPLSISAESLLAWVDACRVEANRLVDKNRRSELGQFFTPAPIAQLMASMLADRPAGAHIRILDAGAGVGSLTAAAVAELCRREALPAAGGDDPQGTFLFWVGTSHIAIGIDRPRAACKLGNRGDHKIYYGKFRSAQRSSTECYVHIR